MRLSMNVIGSKRTHFGKSGWFSRSSRSKEVGCDVVDKVSDFMGSDLGAVGGSGDRR
jgi:hypothetical protein